MVLPLCQQPKQAGCQSSYHKLSLFVRIDCSKTSAFRTVRLWDYIVPEPETFVYNRVMRKVIVGC